MKIYRILLSLIIPFWNFASEINLSSSKKRPASISSEELQEDLGVKVKSIKNTNEDEINNQLIESFKSRDYYKIIEILKSLIPLKIDISTIRNIPLLNIACSYGQLEIVEYLISEGSDINTRSIGGITPLHEACGKGHLGVVEYLISKGANINDLNDSNYSSLHLACHHGHLEVVKYLISKDLRLLSIVSLDNEYPLNFIKESKDIEDLLHFIEIENIKAPVKLELKSEYLGKWSNHKLGGLFLLQQGVEHQYGNMVFEKFYQILGRSIISKSYITSEELDYNPLSAFNLIKEKVKELILCCKWSSIRGFQGMRLDSHDKRSKRFISIFFTPYQIFQLIKAQYRLISNSDEMKEFIKIVRMEYDLTKVTNENNLNLLHVFALNIDICTFIISVNPKLITTLPNEKRYLEDKPIKPYLTAFFTPCQIFQLIKNQYEFMLHKYEIISRIQETLESFRGLSFEEKIDRANRIINEKLDMALKSGSRYDKNIWTNLKPEELLKIIEENNRRNILEMNISDEIKKIIKKVSIEYNLTTLSDENNINLLDVFSSNIDVLNYIVSINPQIIDMKYYKGRIFLYEFYRNLLNPDVNDQMEVY